MTERSHSAIRNPKVLLLYPPSQTWPGYMCKPNGSLAYPMLGGALRDAGIEVEVFDACVGNDKDDLNEVFYKTTNLPTGLIRAGVSPERILEEVAGADVVGITSIFTDQETMVLNAIRLIKAAHPEKLVISGGVNARHRLDRFFAAGVDVVCLSEAERTIIRIIERMKTGSRDFSALSAVAVQKDGRIVSNRTLTEDVVMDLDDLPVPAWDLLPNERYWKIARPHGGHFEPGVKLRYASMMTSLGCVFSCSYCHIAKETEGEASGKIGAFRVKSIDRVLRELDILKDMGVKQVFVEDDTLFGYKQRAVELLKKIKGYGFDILDVNGVNLVHLFKSSPNGFIPDREVLDALVESGFKEFVLAFESGNQRILTKYASNKWNVQKFDIHALLKAIKEYGIEVNGNYMIGYPDETREEIETTIDMARRHRDAGLGAANFFTVMPLPGTTLFDWAVADGHLPRDFEPDRMNWTKANMINTVVPPDQLERIRQQAWQSVNDAEWVKYKLGMSVKA